MLKHKLVKLTANVNCKSLDDAIADGWHIRKMLPMSDGMAVLLWRNE